MLEIQGLSKSYGKNLAVDEVSFTVRTGRWASSSGRTAREIHDHKKYRGAAQIQRHDPY